MKKLYPESKVEIRGFAAKHYDIGLNIATLGKYSFFISNVIDLLGIQPHDRILDLGAGTGRNACLMMRYLSEEGEVVGLDISKDMISQFKKRCGDCANATIVNARIDQPLPLKQQFDKVFISFVLHGFPQSARISILQNAFEALHVNGNFFILDYSEYSYNNAPFYLRTLFKLIECPYAFDFIKRDWKQILEDRHFGKFEEFFFFRNYLRLLKATKLP